MSKAADIHGQIIFQRIIAEIERIRWRIEGVTKRANTLRTGLERLFADEKLMGRRRYWKEDREYRRGDAMFRRSGNSGGAGSCLYVGKAGRLTHKDRRFIRLTQYMDLLVPAVTVSNSDILFVHLNSPGEITRGYPWKDFSVLPSGFRTTQQCFFFPADEAHNPERKEVWTEPYLCPLLKTWMVSCLIPAWNGDEFIGVVGLDVDLGQIIKAMADTLRTIDCGYAVLISPNRNLIISSDDGMNQMREDKVLMGDGWPIADGLEGHTLDRITVREVMLTSGQAYILYTYFRTAGWNLACVLPKDIKVVQEQRVPLTIENAFPPMEMIDASEVENAYQPIMSFMASFSESLSQIEKLIEGTKKIGQGVFDHRIEVDRKDEIGLLAMSINSMAEELRKKKTELQNTYEKISQMDRLTALGTLSAGIAHEINNPLSVISGCVQVLLKNPEISREAEPDLLLIEEEVLRISDIIANLLCFSRQSDMKKSPIQINDLLQSTLSLLRFQLKSLSIKLFESYDPELPYIFGDSTHLQQVFLNIFMNSLQAVKDGGILRVTTSFLKDGVEECSGGTAEIVIVDSGEGIDKRDLNRVFDPFFTTKPIGQGTGLGLPISYGIIKDHEGIINIESAPGCGTTVRICLPVL
jgi:signal transduction histidine kinase